MKISSRLFSSKSIALFVWTALLGYKLIVRRTESFAIGGSFDPQLGMEIAFVACITVLSFWVFATNAGALFLRGSQPVAKFFGLYVLVCGIASIGRTFNLYAMFWLLVLVNMWVALSVMSMGNDTRTIRRALNATIGVFAIYPVITIYEYLNGLVYAGRIFTAGLHPGVSTALYLSIAILLLTRKSGVVQIRIMNCALFTLFFSGAILTSGKAAFVVFIALVCLALIRQDIKISARTFFVLLAGGFILIHLKGSSVGVFKHLELYNDIRSASDLPTLSARFELWSEILADMASSPDAWLLGKGFTYSRQHLVGSGVISMQVTHAHNSILNVLLETGVLGFMVVVGLLAATAKSVCIAFKKLPHLRSYGYAWLLLMACSMTDQIFGGLVNPTSQLLILISTYFYISIHNPMELHRTKQATT